MRSAKRGFTVYGCKLTRPDLDAILQTAAAGASNDARVSVSTTQGISKVKTATLDDLLAETGNPDRLADLEIEVYEHLLESEQMRYASVSVDPRRTWVYSSGPDETWVRGRAEELRDVLRSHRVRLAGPPATAPTAAMAFFSIFAWAVIFPINLTLPSKLSESSELAVPLTLLVADLGLSFAVWRWWRRRNTTEIVLAGATGKAWSRGDRIGLGVLIVGVVALAVAAFQVWKTLHP